MADFTANLSVGDVAPDFSLPDATGNLVRLSDFRGQRVVLYFYPRDNTPGCTQEACGFRDRYDDFLTAGSVVLGVSADDAKSHAKFIAKYDLPFPLLCDENGAVATRYGSYGRKKFMGKEYDGVYRHTFVIDADGCIAGIYRQVKPEPHAAQVLADLRAIAASSSTP
jgi:peroxiredoxin Q/BCP